MQLDSDEVPDLTDDKDVLRLAETFVAYILRNTRPCDLTLLDLYLAEATEEAARTISRLEAMLPSVVEI